MPGWESEMKLRFKSNPQHLRTYEPKKWRLDRNRRKYWWVVWVSEPGRGWLYCEAAGDYREYPTKAEAKARCDELNAWWQENGRIHAMLDTHTEVNA